MENDKDAEAATGFMNIANSLRDLASKMGEAQKNGEPIDVFASFREAMNLVQSPTPEKDVLDSGVVE